LVGTVANDESHNSLTLATALGHLELHIKNILELAPKIPPVDSLARLLRKYLSVIVRSSTYAQETAATMSAYTILRGSRGLDAANKYLNKHKRPSPYTEYVDRAIDLFRKCHIPYQHWAGYMLFLASLSMNTNIDKIVEALVDFKKFEEICARSPISADTRFRHIFAEFEKSIGQGGLPAETEHAMERNYNHISKVVSHDLPRLIADALRGQSEDFGLNDYEKTVLDYVSDNPIGYPGKCNIQTVFYAAQPKRRATPENYLFRMNDEDCAKCDLVEMGLASLYENVTYGGISINFYIVTSPPIKTGFWMLHPCCAARCHSLIDNKTIVIYVTWDILRDGTALWPIRRLITDRRVIYLFFGNHAKFVSWIEKHTSHLVYVIAEIQQPPIRFVLFRDQRDSYSTYVLPVAPIPCGSIDDILSNITCIEMSEFANAELQADLEKFFPWYVFAPITC
jgi:hypothetical protein